MDVTYLSQAVERGAEIRDRSFVTGVERNEAGRITGVVSTKGGETFRQRCQNVFLCAGAVETPRQLLMWDVANSSGMVGRNFMVHVATQVWGTFDEPTRRTGLGARESIRSRTDCVISSTV
jgi:choline dehydrogenase-like flavoprotein